MEKRVNGPFLLRIFFFFFEKIFVEKLMSYATNLEEEKEIYKD